MRARLCIQPRSAQLAHGSIHHRVTGAALLPGLQFSRIIPPGDIAQGGLESPLQNVRKMVEDGLVKLAPDQLVEEGLSSLAGLPLSSDRQLCMAALTACRGESMPKRR